MSWSDGPERVLVRVPATSANLGPGFDSLGLALTLYDEVEARVVASELDIDVTGEGAADVADAREKHLIVRAMRAAFDDVGRGQPPGIALRCVNRIPHGRGLGSSAAAIVAGVLAGRALAGVSVAPDDGLPLASQLEGHPDNVAPCLYGGLTVAWMTDSSTAGGTGGSTGSTGGGVRGVVARAVRLEPVAGIRPVAIIAPAPVSTEVARGLLPRSVPHEDAARNAGRAALLVAALTQRPEALLDATEDRLHQDYRAPAMPATHDLVLRLRAAGVPAVVSGAGPSVLAFLGSGDSGIMGASGALASNASSSGTPRLESLRDGLDILDSTVKETGIDWRISPLDIERHGASVMVAV
ncbi:MAG: homoserine kinase [Trebonia sp.]